MCFHSGAVVGFIRVRFFMHRLPYPLGVVVFAPVQNVGHRGACTLGLHRGLFRSIPVRPGWFLRSGVTCILQVHSREPLGTFGPFVFRFCLQGYHCRTPLVPLR